MTEMSDGTIVTDIDNRADNYRLTSRGYTIRHIETWHDHALRAGTDVKMQGFRS